LQQARQSLEEGTAGLPIHRGGIINNALQLFRDAFQKSILDDPEGSQKLAKYLFTPEGSELLEQIAKTPNLTKQDKLNLGTKLMLGAGGIVATNQVIGN
jgi:hypothetical protein